LGGSLQSYENAFAQTILNLVMAVAIPYAKLTGKAFASEWSSEDAPFLGVRHYLGFAYWQRAD
jgi:hypothetical protein